MCVFNYTHKNILVLLKKLRILFPTGHSQSFTTVVLIIFRQRTKTRTLHSPQTPRIPSFKHRKIFITKLSTFNTMHQGPPPPVQKYFLPWAIYIKQNVQSFHYWSITYTPYIYPCPSIQNPAIYNLMRARTRTYANITIRGIRLLTCALTRHFH